MSRILNIVIALKFELFVANRLAKGSKGNGTFSGPVTFLSITAIALGLAIMILALATGAGLQKTIEQKVIGFNGHIQITHYNASNGLEETPIETGIEWKSHLTSLPEIQHIQPVSHKAGIAKSTTQFEGTLLKGVSESYDFSFFQANLKQGSIPKFDQNTANDSIILSQKLAAILDVSLYDTLTVFFLRESPKPPLQRVFFISALFNTGLDEFDKNVIIGDLKHVQRLNNWGNSEIGGYEILLTDLNNLEATGEKVRSIIPYDLDAATVRENNEQIFQWLALFDVNIIIIIVIVLVVASINTVVALLILILESTTTIGLLKAMGATNKQLNYIFLGRALHLLAKGLVLGNFIGLAICYAQAKFQWIQLDPEVYYVDAIAIYINPLHIALLNVGTILFSLLVLLLPVRIIAKISPTKAIRFQ